MAPCRVALCLLALAVFVSTADGATVEHVFRVGDIRTKHLCKDSIITVVNEQFPGPLIEITDGDTVMVHVINESPHGATIHWHGIKQQLSCWADGVGMVTQCPMRPKSMFTYQFNVTGQEGTLWWHAHNAYLRATMHGALIIRPKGGDSAYPFSKPDEEIPIIIGDWWQVDVTQLEKKALSGTVDDFPVAFAINGKLGDTYNCSGIVEDSYILDVDSRKTYLLRITNAVLYYEIFYKVAGHKFTVVAADANYVKPYSTDVIVIAPGQTIDALMVADAPPGQYYMVAKSNQSPYPNGQIPNFITRGIVRYTSASPLVHHPMMPQMPDTNDFLTPFQFYGSLSSLMHPSQPSVPLHVDEHLFITIGLGQICKRHNSSCKESELMLVATMNDVSFQLPTKLSLLEAHHNKVKGVYTQDFPNKPPKFFNFTDEALIIYTPRELELTSKGTKVKKLKYNSTVEVILQGTAVFVSESHAIHLHGYSFFLLAQGFGNYNPEKDPQNYNLVDPPLRNTLAVPLEGWAVIRFIADNPGMWLMHCHMEYHLPMGMATVLEVENGLTADAILPPPPAGFPQCPYHNLIQLDNTIEYELE